MVPTWGKKYHFEKKGGGKNMIFWENIYPRFFLMDWGI